MADGMFTPRRVSDERGISVAQPSVKSHIVPIASYVLFIFTFIRRIHQGFSVGSILRTTVRYRKTCSPPVSTCHLVHKHESDSLRALAAVWFLLLASTGIYNITSFPGIFRAFDPSRAVMCG